MHLACNSIISCSPVGLLKILHIMQNLLVDVSVAAGVQKLPEIEVDMLAAHQAITY